MMPEFLYPLFPADVADIDHVTIQMKQWIALQLATPPNMLKPPISNVARILGQGRENYWYIG